MKKKILSFIFAICLIIPCVLFVGCGKDKESSTAPELGEEVSVLFSEDGKTLYRFAPDNDETEYTVPDGVTTIKIAAFENCDNLKRVVLPNSLVSLEEKAFYNCNNLTTVEINSNIVIEARAFSGCQKLSTIDTSKIISYGEYAFSDCDALVSVTIAKKISQLPEGVFSETDLLSTINFETDSELHTIGKQAFYNSGLASITLPDSCTTITDSAFALSKLTSIIIGKNITNLCSSAFERCYNLLTVDFEIGRTKDLEFRTIYSDYSIGQKVFADCSNLTTVTNYPMVTIVDSMFSGCEELETFTFSNEDISLTLASVRPFAFFECSSLQEIDLHENIAMILDNSFLGCSSLKTIYINTEHLVEKNVDEGILYNADSVYIKTGLSVPNLTYLLENFTKQETSDKIGYDMYVRNAE